LTVMSGKLFAKQSKLSTNGARTEVPSLLCSSRSIMSRTRSASRLRAALFGTAPISCPAIWLTHLEISTSSAQPTLVVAERQKEAALGVVLVLDHPIGHARHGTVGETAGDLVDRRRVVSAFSEVHDTDNGHLVLLRQFRERSQLAPDLRFGVAVLGVDERDDGLDHDRADVASVLEKLLQLRQVLLDIEIAFVLIPADHFE